MHGQTKINPERLRELREKRGLSQRALATLAGTTQAQISRIEAGEGKPGLLGVRLALALQTSPGDLCSRWTESSTLISLEEECRNLLGRVAGERVGSGDLLDREFERLEAALQRFVKIARPDLLGGESG